MLLRTLLAPVLFLSLTATPASAQQVAPRDTALFHERVVSVMRQLATRPLPAGDTLVTWTTEPVLFHTSAIGDDTARAGVIRGDGMLGTTTVTWSAGRPAAFMVRWTTPTKPEQDIRGTRSGGALQITGTHDTIIQVPAVPWAVADFGMESLLIPLLRRLPANVEQRIVVLRPFALQWDTLTTTLQTRGGVMLAELRDTKGTRTWMAIGGGHHLLWLHQSGPAMERRPLEGTARYRDYARIRSLIGALE